MNPLDPAMHVYLRSTPQSVNMLTGWVSWPMARVWCGKQVRFGETVNLRGVMQGVRICEGCAHAIEHDTPGRTF